VPNPKKPRALKLLSGTYRAHRDNPDQPNPPVISVGRPPPQLSAAGKAAWPEVCACVAPLRIVTRADLIGLCEFAECVGDLRRARESLAQALVLNGQTVSEPNEHFYWSRGMRRARPELFQIDLCVKRLGNFISRFGASPADRARVTALPIEGHANVFSEF